MQIKDFLSTSNVAIDVQAPTKAALLSDLARRAAAELKLDADAVANEIEKRDELGSTGIGGGVALPHARLREIKKPYGLLARLKSPIDFDAIELRAGRHRVPDAICRPPRSWISSTLSPRLPASSATEAC